MKFVFLFFILASTSFTSMAASCESSIGRGSCTFFPQTTIVIDRVLGLTITNEKWHEATFNELNNKFDDLTMPFTVESTTGDPILYSLKVLESEHACYDSISGSAVGEATFINVNLSVDGLNANLDDVIPPIDGASISKDHELKLHFGDDHPMGINEKWCLGQVQIQAELIM
ncbi:hypothetical protein ACPSL3_07620 [Vibrio owensii]|uniref:hypothetical protein n=1 Tax=Vibrio owensii TaxID=696485 RepID=UPI003CE5C75E